MESWTLATFFLIAAQVVVPVLWFTINYFVRGGFGLSQSSGADAILTLLAFDIAVLIDGDTFRQVVRHAEFATNIGLAHIVFLSLGLLFWVFALRYSEPSIVDAQTIKAGDTDDEKDATFWFLGWALLTLLIIVHVTYYVLPGAQSSG